MEPKDYIQMQVDAFRDGGRTPRIVDLAGMQVNTAKLEEELKGKEDQLTGLPEFQAFEDAKKALEEAQRELEATDLANQIHDLQADIAEAKSWLEDMLADYKRARIDDFEHDGTKEYPGGNIQVRKRFVISDHDELKSTLIERGLLSYLLPDQKTMGKELNPEVAKALGLSKFVEWEKYPVASISKDLSEYWEE